MGTTLWAVRILGKDDVYGVFSSKKEAAKELMLWADNGTKPYRILTNLRGLRFKSERMSLVTIQFENGDTETLTIRPEILDNGANFIHFG